MPKIQIPPIQLPKGADTQLQEFQLTVTKAFQSLCTQINAQPFTKDTANEALDMGQQRVTNVSQPAAEGDAVNLGYLRRSFKSNSPTQRSGGGNPYYQIVFGSPGDITLGTLVDFAYDVGINRSGSPVEANISALVPPTGTSIAVNFLVYSGTSTSTLLSSDLVLGTAVSTMVVSSAFNAIPLQYLDRVVLKVNRIGTTDPGSLVTVGLVVKAGG